MTSQALALRDYQERAVQEIRLAYRNGTDAALLVLPTGGGKTVILSYITLSMIARNSKVLILVHRRELIQQTSDTLSSLGVGHGVIAAGKKTSDNPVQVASVQTLVRRLHKVNFCPDLIIVDEAHHAVAGSWSKILENYFGTRILGVTATPMRLDGKGLKAYFQQMIKGPSVAELTEQKYLAPARCFTIPKKFDRKQIGMSGGDFIASKAEELLMQGKINGDAVREYKRHCPGKPALVFCCTIKHSQYVAKLFADAGFRAAHLSANTDHATRKQLIEDLGNGRLDILTNCMVVSEGTDIPVVTAAILLRPTESEALYLQQVGRVLRPAPDKTHAIVIDCVGNILRHGLPDAERNFSLNDRPKGESAPPVKECPVCYAVHPIQAERCNECGHIFISKSTPEKPAEIVDLVEITKTTKNHKLNSVEMHQRKLRVAKAQTFVELDALRIEFGYKPGWVYKIMQERSHRRARNANARGMNWTDILAKSNIPEPPGYQDALNLVRNRQT